MSEHHRQESRQENCNRPHNENESANKPHNATVSVIEKIRKLLALADGNQNENERAVAMEAAMELLARHNLSMSHIQDNALDKLGVEQVATSFKMDPWIRAVLNACSKLYYTDWFCETVRDRATGSKTKTVIFVGTPENIAVTTDVAVWLIDSIRKESNKAYKDELRRRSFRLGASCRLNERVEKMMEAEKKPSSAETPGTSLLVLRNHLQEANQEYLSKLKMQYSAGRGSRLGNTDAFAEGQEYGNGLHLGKQESGVRGRVPVFSGG